MAAEFDKLAAELVAHPDYQPSPKPPPLGVLARRQPCVPRKPEALRRRAGSPLSHHATSRGSLPQQLSSLGGR
jgi:hypothetical protein